MVKSASWKEGPSNHEQKLKITISTSYTARTTFLFTCGRREGAFKIGQSTTNLICLEESKHRKWPTNRSIGTPHFIRASAISTLSMAETFSPRVKAIWLNYLPVCPHVCLSPPQALRSSH